MSTSHYPKNGSRLDADDIKARLRDPDAFARITGLISADTPRKAKHNKLRCPYCGQNTLSVWMPPDDVDAEGKVVAKTVIGTCQWGGCNPRGTKTHRPLDLLGKVKGWAMTGPDFQKVLTLADVICRSAGVSAATAVAFEAPAVKVTTPPATKVKAPAAAPKAPPAEDDEPIYQILHPDLTPREWGNLQRIKVDPIEVRTRPWLAVVPNRDDQPPALRERLAEGFTVWLTTYDAQGEEAGHCEVYTGADPDWDTSPSNSVLAGELGRRVLEMGPDDLSSWPKAQQVRPKLYLGVGPIDFMRVEPIFQRRLLPSLGATEKSVPPETLGRIPPACEIVVLGFGDPSKRHEQVMTSLQDAGRRFSFQAPQGAAVQPQ